MALENKEQIYTEKSTLKNWFSSKLKPTQGQFWAWLDSYWHKGEKLPINTIDGLGEAVDGKAPLVHYHEQYATNDATSLSAENITQWKKKLDVDNLQFNDRAISLTGEYTDFGLNHTSKQSQFNEAMYASNQTKLNEPTSEGTEEEYPFLVGIDEDGYSAKLPAGDLGKNFANTDLQVLENRKHTGTASVEFAMPLVCSNSNVLYSGLVDKSSDVMYNIFPVLDSNGNLAKATAIGNALESGLKSVSADQALRISKLLNGGIGSSGAMSVSLISPPIVQKIDSKEYIVLRGANLNLNSTDYSISILKVSDKTLVGQIPNSQIQLYSDGLSLVFYYNFKDLVFGEYILRIQSGAKVYDTTLTIQVVQNVNSININAITWTKKYADGYIAPSSDIASGSSVFTQTINTSNTSNILSSFKSSEVFVQGQDFLIEMTVSTGMVTSSSGANTLAKNVIIGLGYSDQVIDLVNQTLINYNLIGVGTNLITRYVNNTTIASSVAVPSQVTVTLIKTGNFFRISVGNTIYSSTFSNKSGYSLFIHNIGVQKGITSEINITKAFTFN